MTIYKSVFFYLLIYATYLELHPSIGNVWFRTASDGLRRINLQSLGRMIFAPLQMKELWYPNNWDLNFFVGVFATFGVLKIYKDYKIYKDQLNKQK